MTQQIPLELIVPNPEQPRVVFDEVELLELADSIREQGVILPISVERAGALSYILHDGERRWRAAALAGLTTIPATIEAPLNGSGPATRLVRALVANVQRSQMHPVEEGRAYARLRDEFGLSDRQIAAKTGKSYSHVNMRQRLVDLDIEIQNLMLAGKLPTSPPVVRAFKSLGSELRVELAETLAERAGGKLVAVATIKRAVAILEKQAKKEAALSQGGLGTGNNWNIFAFARIKRSALPEAVGSAANMTCKACPLLSTASEAMCNECPLVEMLRRIDRGRK